MKKKRMSYIVCFLTCVSESHSKPTVRDQQLNVCVHFLSAIDTVNKYKY